VPFLFQIRLGEKIMKLLSGQTQWVSGLKHILSSAARSLGSWVQISFEALTCVHIFLCCVVLYVGRGLVSG
jgi:hypothetical protein